MNLGSSIEPRLKERLRKATRAALLDAAEATFARRGLQGARVDDIAAAAGVSVGTLYNHFGDREQLLQALLVDRRNDLLAHLDQPLHEGQAVPFARLLEAFVRAALRHFDAHRALIQLLMEEETSQLRGGKRRHLMAHDFVERVEQLIRLGVHEGTLRADDAADFPVFFTGLVRATIVRAKGARGHEPLEQRAPVIVRFFLAGAQR